MKIVPRINEVISVIEETLDSEKYLISPDIDKDFPNIQEPQENPNRDSQVVRWNSKLLSYELPDGATFFCDLLQSGDPLKSNGMVKPGDFMKNEERVYQSLSNWKQLISVLSEYQMRSYMAGHAAKQIVFFKEAVEHICRACRVLRQSGGHMLLIGLDGTGKSTVMELALFISNCEMLKLSVKKGYNYTDFRDDLKNVFKLAGIQKKKIVLFISDKDIYEVNMKNKKTEQK